MKKVNILILSAAVLGITIFAVHKKSEDSFNLVLFSTTDIHGSLFPYDGIKNEPVDHSLAQVSYLLNDLRKNKKNEVIYLDGGDFYQGDSVIYYFTEMREGPNVGAAVLNYLKLDSMAVGNHDIERGHPVYDKVVKEMEFPFMAANAIDKTTKNPYFPPYTIINRRGVKIAVLGMVTPSLTHSIPEYLWDRIEFEDIVESSEKWIPIIRENENPDLIVGLFHSGLGTEKREYMGENVSLYTALNVDGFDIIFKGHDHLTHLTNVISPSGKPVVVLGGANAVKTASQVQIPIKKVNGKWSLGQAKGSIIAFENKNKPADQQFLTHFKNEFTEATNVLAQPIGTLSQPISSKKSLFGPSEFVDFIHQLQYNIVQKELGMPVDFSIAGPFSLSDISTNVVFRDLFGIYYYDNWPAIVELKGSEIKKMLEYFFHGWFNTMTGPDSYLLDYIFNSKGQMIPDHRGGVYVLKKPFIYFDNLAGLDFTIDLRNNPGDRVTIEKLSNGQLLIITKNIK
ncbi:2',3'-cyclic-nucleotide 2'-phosphodiesterase / 3'-nucleotidase [Brevinema andersonii]|uniref:2',3'-cyclic-nucleotide 2'-phosphodiesterase / 3'-nucleotidase n=1 Tax=Brevinema andersonii TaxID=34097 RepID=A0A1I1DFZ7_BREAD|nr:5'-nucleotidase C-terminal domain-containing protein [Brevinema andersonii]SFB73909.1 2',3'-cyclic-nucleotide 2'-phosphodiesterase / 3'-nucleotidase [Brevinema andersonii]